MYIPEMFHESDAAEIEALMDRYSLAIVVAFPEDGLTAHHLPLLRDGADRLIGHVARANPLHSQLEDGAEILAIFRGEEAYISPNWYPSKLEHHGHVPTWNYRAVHVTGNIVFEHDEKSKRTIVGRLTKKHETALNGQQAWRMADAPPDYMNEMLENIVAFRIEITSIIAKSKLSQNRTTGDFKAVAEQMDKAGKPDLARRMKAIRDDSAI